MSRNRDRSLLMGEGVTHRDACASSRLAARRSCHWAAPLGFIGFALNTLHCEAVLDLEKYDHPSADSVPRGADAGADAGLLAHPSEEPQDAGLDSSDQKPTANVGDCAGGQFEPPSTCSDAASHCNEAGPCVVCTDSTQCLSPDTCLTGSCNVATGVCVFSPKPPGSDCGGGLSCDASGRCNGCDVPEDCKASDACHLRSCVNHACGQDAAPARTTCNFDGGVLCNAVGACVECLDGTDCMGPKPICSGGHCVECAPNAAPTHCASACTKTRQFCSPEGTWTDYSETCASAELCSEGACISPSEEYAGLYDALSGSADAYADLLIATRIQISCRSDLLRLGARFMTADGSVRFALYTDAAGVPGNVVAGTDAVPVSVGTTEAEASSTVLDEGFYWVVSNLSSATAAPLQDSSASVPANSSRYANYAFSTAVWAPVSFPASSGLATLFNQYVVVFRDP
jgi:hypothetical protein